MTSLEDTTIGGGKYAIKAGTPVLLQTWVAMKDPKVFGEDTREFKPERMLDGKFEALPPNAWQPFGYGVRGCIGRGFALQEIPVSLIPAFNLIHCTESVLALYRIYCPKIRSFIRRSIL